MEDILDIAAHFLQDVPETQSTAYVVDASNPVCPHCGAKLVINDGTTAAETNQLCTDQITESFATGEDIIPLIKETAEDILDAYFEQEDADPKELYYITNPTIKSVIHRKAIELCSILKNNYELQVTTEIIESQIKKMLKFLVQQVR